MYDLTEVGKKLEILEKNLNVLEKEKVNLEKRIERLENDLNVNIDKAVDIEE